MNTVLISSSSINLLSFIGSPRRKQVRLCITIWSTGLITRLQGGFCSVSIWTFCNIYRGKCTLIGKQVTNGFMLEAILISTHRYCCLPFFQIFLNYKSSTMWISESLCWEPKIRNLKQLKRKSANYREFLGSPVVRTLHFHCRECGFNPSLGN